MKVTKLGGLFVLHALFPRPELFTHYVAGSPSVWWGNYAVLAEQERFSASYPERQLQRKLLITMGAEEHDHMVEDAEKLPGLLEPLAEQGLQVSLAKFAEESHVSVLPAALSRLLKFALQKP
jgi:hypothetical protein